MCGVCDEKFVVKSDYMKHKKNQHPTNTSICKKYKEFSSCQFGDKCWFIHKDSNESMNNSTLNNENTEKLFEILEKFTERIVILEHQIKGKENNCKEIDK